MRQTSWFNSRVLTICLVESAERFSYYGTNSQLALFLTSGPPALPPSLSSSSVSVFTALAYATPLLGANIASHRGMYHTILYLGAVYLLGALFLPFSAIPSPISLLLSLSSLFLLALGTGGIKPNVVAFGALQVADEPTEENDPRLTSFFTAFYFVINFGAILGQIIVPAIQKHFGFAYSFFTSFIVLFVSLLIFVIGNYYPGYVHESPKDETQPVDKPLDLLRITLATRLGTNWTVVPQDVKARLRNPVRSLRLMFPIVTFWTGYMAMSSSWILQADDTELPLSLSAAQWTALNPCIVLATLPIVSRISTHFNISIESRIAAGMTLGAISVFFSALVQTWVGQEHKISGLWTLPHWIGLSLAEVLASVSSLELAHRGAPEELKSAMQAAWLVVTAVGSGVAAVVFAVSGGMTEALIILASIMIFGVFVFFAALRHNDDDGEFASPEDMG